MDLDLHAIDANLGLKHHQYDNRGTWCAEDIHKVSRCTSFSIRALQALQRAYREHTSLPKRQV